MNIDHYITAKLNGDAGQNALNLVAHLTSQGMSFERGTGYWEDKLYWYVKFNDEFVCFILINENEWTVWSDDSGADSYADFPLDEDMKEIAWQYVDFCGNCGSCGGGTKKTIFGKEFDNVCRTTFRFDNPDNLAVGCLKKLTEIRK